jgi:hypothetical protein
LRHNLGSSGKLLAKPIAIDWDPSLPVFAKESFLKSVGEEYGWLGGVAPREELRCLLPYVIIKKFGVKMARFRTETIPIPPVLDIAEEKAFLTSAMDHFRERGIGLILPASNNAIFLTYPDGAEAVPYGTYWIDLTLSEGSLWKNIDRVYRQNIKSATQSGVVIHDGRRCLREGYALIRRTFRRSRLPFMTLGDFERFVDGLGRHGVLSAASFQGTLQSFVVFGFSDFAAYAIYAGNADRQQKGSNKLLYWEAMRTFKTAGIGRFDFYGARINPEKGSKQEALASFKRHFGAELKVGYMWRYTLRPVSGLFYRLGMRLMRHGDVIQDEIQRARRGGKSPS